MRRTTIKALLALLAGCALLAVLVHTGVVHLPDRHNPWSPLSIDEPPGWLTRLKLARLARDPGACLGLLARSQLRFTRIPDREVAPGCAFVDAVRVEAGTLEIDPDIALSCRAAVSFALWERHVLQPAAHQHFGQPAARLEHFGSFACRNLYGRSDAPRSRHATADALDIAGVVLADGRRVRVAADWAGAGVEAVFLRDLHAGACRVFDAVLGPGYNAAHHDHFHVERGGRRVCR